MSDWRRLVEGTVQFCEYINEFRLHLLIPTNAPCLVYIIIKIELQHVSAYVYYQRVENVKVKTNGR